MRLNFLLFTLSLYLLRPGRALGQDSAYVVLAPIRQGPAAVFIDGAPRGQLADAELTLAVLPGRRALSVRRDGFAPFQREVTVAPGDVQQITVVLEPVTASISEDRPEQGTSRQGTGKFRVIHLEPVKTDISVEGQRLGETPATILVPSGEHEVQVGSYAACWVVTPGDSGYLRLRSGRLEQMTGISLCDRRPIPVILIGVPENATLTINDDPIRPAPVRPGVWETTVRRPGTYVLTLGGEYVPLELELDVRWGDSVEAIVDLGLHRPRPRGDTLPPPRPSPASIPEHERPQEPLAPDTTQRERLERDKRRCRTQAQSSRGTTSMSTCRAIGDSLEVVDAQVEAYRAARKAYRQQVRAIDSLNSLLAPRRAVAALEDSVRLAAWRVSDSLAVTVREANRQLLDQWRTGAASARKPPVVRVIARRMP